MPDNQDALFPESGLEIGNHLVEEKSMMRLSKGSNY
jgi:hypothetical protein